MNASNPVTFTVTAQPLPTPWLDQDLGQVGIAGSASFTNGTFTVKGAGSQVWGTADSFHFAYQVLSGDGTIVARVVSISPTSATPGVMIRDSLNPNAMSAFGSYYASNAYLNYRSSTGGSTSQASAPAGSLPYWLKLSRSGSTVSAYTSADGVNWTPIGSPQTINMGQSVYIGLVVCSNSTSTLAAATFDNVSVSSIVAPPPSFTLSASPSSLSIPQRSSGASTISVTPQNGFSGSGSLSASGQPSGVTASSSTNPATASSSLTLTASSTATTGAFSVVVTGTSGSLTNTTTIALTVTAVSTALPLSWSDGDVGTVGLVGSAAFTNGTFTVNGAGSQVWGTADSFHFAYQVLSGDGSIVARVVSISPTSATPGVMIRDSLNPNAMSAFGSYYASNAYLNYRSSTGGSTSQSSAPAGSLPYWLKLSRSGSTVSAYTSADGVNWTPIGSPQTINMGQSVYIGLVVCSNSTSTLAAATFDNVSVSSIVAPPPSFTLSASPSSLSIPQGSSGASTISVTPQNGFSGSVSLSASGQPSGVTASFSTNPATASSTLTLTASSTATTGTFSVVVTGTSGSLTNTTTIALTVTAVSTALPLSWSDGDVGTVGLVGSAAFTNGTFTVNGAGSQVWGTADSFHFAYQVLSGDGSIVARVVSISPTSATPGVMIRDSLNPNAMSAFGSYYASNAYLNYRSSTGGSTSQSSAPAGSLPYWLKLSRSGSTVSAYTSADGVNWTPIGSPQTINMGQSVYIGLVVCSNSTSTLAAATFDNVSVSSIVAPPPSFTLSASPSSLSIPQGSSGASTISVTPQNGFSGSVSLSASGQPSGVTASFSTNPATASSTLTLTASSTATTGTFSVVVTGTSGSLTNTTTIALTVTAVSTALPLSWSDGDVGTVGLVGSAAFTNGTFTVNGAGSQVWGTADSFHFAYQVLSGDGSIVARVVSISPTSATPGVMIRDSLNPNAMSAFGAYFNSNAYLNYRSTTGGNTSQSSAPAGSLPYWLKVSRSGSTVSAYTSADGVNWVPIGSSQTINMD